MAETWRIMECEAKNVDLDAQTVTFAVRGHELNTAEPRSGEVQVDLEALGGEPWLPADINGITVEQG